MFNVHKLPVAAVPFREEVSTSQQPNCASLLMWKVENSGSINKAVEWPVPGQPHLD